MSVTKLEGRESEQSTSQTANALLALIREVGSELRLNPMRLDTLTLDSSLDKDLGLDSLMRAEVVARIENQFDITLSEQVFADIETPRDLLREIQRAAPASESISIAKRPAEDTATPGGFPYQAQTLVEALNWHAEKHPERTHIRLFQDDDNGENLSYRELQTGAESVAASLQHLGLSVGQSVSIMLPTGKDYFFTFFGILIAGGVPVPIYPPARLKQLEDHLLRHKKILGNCQAVLLITMPEALHVARLLKSQVEQLSDVLTPDDLYRIEAKLTKPKLSGQDIAFLQYTSGSTGVPKGVVLTHSNLLTNIRAMGEAVAVDSSDVFVSWLPLYHDMGLIGAWLGSLYFGMQLVIMSPLAFLASPARWLRAVHRYRGTLTAGPNFAYQLCLKRINGRMLESLDLSSLRAAFNGAEPISPVTVEAFSEHFATAGFQRSAMMPVYGLAENSLGLAFPPLDRGPLTDRIDREIFMKTGDAKPSAADNALAFVSCGLPVVGHQVRIVDSAGRELPERNQGRLQFCGPSATSGYYRSPETTAELFHGEWLDSGDMAYITKGEIYITGRSKDLIIRGGRNIYPQEIEDAVGDIAAIRTGRVAAFASPDPESGGERLIVVAESRESKADDVSKLRDEINRITMDLTGAACDDVVVAPANSVLLTSSGKIRRSACRELYQRGLSGKALKPLVGQFIGVLRSTWLPQWQRAKRSSLSGLYAAYAWTLFLSLAALTWLLVVCCPVVSWRWAIIRLNSRLLTLMLATSVTVEGTENLQEVGTPCIIVSNHASYLDGLFLVLCLPCQFSIVAKAELDAQFFAGTFMRRLNAIFVERFDKQKGLEDAEKIAVQASKGSSMLFFPEGTFARMPGLLPFRTGAFLTAVKTGLPIIPVVIRGTRSILRAHTWYPRHGSVSLNIGTPVYPTQISEKVNETETLSHAIPLRDTVRARMLKYLGEPDLGHEKSPIQ